LLRPPEQVEGRKAGKARQRVFIAGTLADVNQNAVNHGPLGHPETMKICFICFMVWVGVKD
jgi:hypothetical protein